MNHKALENYLCSDGLLRYYDFGIKMHNNKSFIVENFGLTEEEADVFVKALQRREKHLQGNEKTKLDNRVACFLNEALAKMIEPEITASIGIYLLEHGHYVVGLPEKTVSACLETANKLENFDEWLAPFYFLEKAVIISKKYMNKANCLLQVEDLIIEKIMYIKYKDRLYYSIKLTGIIFSQFPGRAAEIVSQVECGANELEQSGFFEKARILFQMLSNYYKSNDEEKHYVFLERVAESLARESALKAEPLVARVDIEDAISIYKNLPRTEERKRRIDELNRTYLEKGIESIPGFEPISVTMDISDLLKKFESDLIPLSLEEKLAVFGDISKFPDETGFQNDIKNMENKLSSIAFSRQINPIGNDGESVSRVNMCWQISRDLIINTMSQCYFTPCLRMIQKLHRKKDIKKVLKELLAKTTSFLMARKMRFFVG